MRLIYSLLILVTVLLGSCTQENPKNNKPIGLFFVPSVDTELIADRSKTIKKLLEKETGLQFKINIPHSYVAVAEAFGTRRSDVAFFNLFGYYLAHTKYQAEAKLVASIKGRKTYRSQIITRVDRGINSLKDLNGKKMAYVDASSMSGYILPSKFLKGQGIQPKEKVFAFRHDSVVTMVYQGQVDAGATSYAPPINGKIQDSRKYVLKQFPDVEERVKILKLTPEIPNPPVVFRKELDADIKNQIIQALLKIIQSDEGKKAFFDIYGVTDFHLTSDKEYKKLLSLLKEINLQK